MGWWWSQQKQVHATNATYERADPLSLFHSFVFIWFFFFGSAVVLDLDLPEGEGRKTALGEAPRNRCRPASALCPDMARGENQMSTSTDNNAYPSGILDKIKTRNISRRIVCAR